MTRYIGIHLIVVALLHPIAQAFQANLWFSQQKRPFITTKAARTTRSQFITYTTSTAATAAIAASAKEEDLELTRQLILNHIAKINGSTSSSSSTDKSSSTSSASGNNNDVDTSHKYYPKNDLMIRAALGQEVDRTPVWLFRQAGRHLPEYREYKSKTNRNFLQLLADPESVVECTLQPLRRYKNLDAAILFSDILVVPEALGIEVTMPGGVGIQVPKPLKHPDEISTRLPKFNDDLTPASLVQTKLQHVLTAVKRICEQVQVEGFNMPLIGFSAAPWTLMFYMVGGSSKKNTEAGLTWLREYPDESRQLLNTLTKVVVEYLSAQVEAGASMLQVFEAMGMMIDDQNFKSFALPCLAEIATVIKGRHPDVPLMVFARGACQMNPQIADLGYDVITIDGSVDRQTARSQVQQTLQGNYDPAELIAENGKTVESVQASAKQLLQDLGPQKLIANLGEGLGGKESPELVAAFLEAIHTESRAMISKAAKESQPQQTESVVS